MWLVRQKISGLTTFQGENAVSPEKLTIKNKTVFMLADRR